MIPAIYFALKGLLDLYVFFVHFLRLYIEKVVGG